MDSYNLLPAMLSETDQQIREATIHHSINGSFSIRKEKWKLIMCPGSGGWSNPRPGSPEAEALPPFQLYDLESDIGETRNLSDQYPDVVSELQNLLQQYIKEGRSTAGPSQANTMTEHWPGIEWMD